MDKLQARRAMRIVLLHLKTQRRYVWGHASGLPKMPSRGVGLVNRTNNVIEMEYHALRQEERRRSVRRILTQDFERLPPAAVLAANLTHTDYVSIVCGSIDRLPEAFAKLDRKARRKPKSPVSLMVPRDDVVLAVSVVPAAADAFDLGRPKQERKGSQGRN